jgi:preprotein translocase subunit SecB
MDPSKPPGLAIAQIFTERLAFSHRDDHMTLPSTTAPVIGDLNIRLTTGESVDGEAGLVRIELQTDPAIKPIYNVELALVGIVQRIKGEENMTIQEFLKSGAAVSLVWPSLRETLANITQRGRFGAVWLNAINPTTMASQLTPAQAAVMLPADIPTPESKPPKRERARASRARKKA